MAKTASDMLKEAPRDQLAPSAFPRLAGVALQPDQQRAHVRRGDAFHAARLAQRFADHAGAVVANAAAFAASELVNENLMRALESRQLIGQATGILMARQNCRAEEAFDMLRRASQRSNRKLREVAEELVRSNDHPTGGGVAS